MTVANLVHAVATFYEGARLNAVGSLLSNNKIIDAGMGKIRQALAVIDVESESGRDILIPFLTHQDSIVRCEAARALHPTRRELATPVPPQGSNGGLCEPHLAGWACDDQARIVEE